MAPIGMTLPIQKGSRGMFNVSDDIMTQIKSNFINLVSTIKGERLNNPTFGCDIHRIIFDPIDDSIYDRARSSIEEAVEQWMPFLQIESFDILTDTNDINRNKISLYIQYRILSFQNITDEVIINI